MWFDTCQSYNCTWVQNCIVRNYTGECLNYTNNYLCQPMDNHTCKSTETCSAFTFDGRCINTTYRDVCDGNYTGLCSDR